MTEIVKGNNESELMEVIRNYGIESQKLEKKLVTAVEALADIENSVSQFADDDYNFIQSGNIANEALKQIGDVSEILMRQALAEIGGEDE
ncbi:hypothetical protein ACFSJM_08405 [Lactococcus formosensis subsp. bovis]|uniref:hypothetical protein n=1 Tax=Lactococcus formosensis TaxID=1281486 RepID=UPI001BCF0BCA|nr:hypothetical protein [Lactococcus formosensis]